MPRLPRKLSGDRTFFQLNFSGPMQAWNLSGKFCCSFATLHDLKSDHLMHCSYQVWTCVAPDSHATANWQTVFSKITRFDRKLPFSASLGPIFVQRFHYTYVFLHFESKPRFEAKYAKIPRYPGTSYKLLNAYPVKKGRIYMNENQEWIMVRIYAIKMSENAIKVWFVA